MIILSRCTDKELHWLLAQADLAMRQAGSDGPSLRDAEQEYSRILEEMERRRHEPTDR